MKPWPKPLLPSQDRYGINAGLKSTDFDSWEYRHGMSRFARIFIWVFVLSGFALIGAAFYFYA